jgi:putative ABC transport system permease protein
LSGSNNYRYFYIEGSPLPEPNKYTGSNYRVISAGYFRTMRIPLLEGRDLTDRDQKETEKVAIINQDFAHRFFPGQDPIGKQLKIGEGPDSPSPWLTIVGVVGDVRHTALDNDVKPEIYLPFLQAPERTMRLAVRGNQINEGLTAAIRQEVLAVDKDQPIAKVARMEQLVDKAVAQRRFNMTLFGVFAAIALVLAAVGIYGVMSYAVTQSTREIGIRMALGAQARDVLKLVVGQAMALTLAGIGIGLAAAYALTRLMGSLLYEVATTDALTFASLSIILAIVALVACYIPARRATKVDPMIALRYE